MMEQVKHDSSKHFVNYDPDLEEFTQIIKNLPDIVKTKLELSRIFKTIHEKMNRGLFYQDILDFVFTSLDSLIPFDRIGIALLENEGHDIRLNWVKSKLPINSLKKDYVAELKGSSLQKIINTEEPRIINDLEEYLIRNPKSKSTQLALQDGIHSNLTCPLILNGSPLGVIFFSSSKTSTYKNSHIDIYSEISQGLALIIQQGLLKEKMSEISTKEKIFRNTIHDLNNPLTIIQGTLEMIIRKEKWYELSVETKKAVNVLMRNCESMISLVHDLTLMSEMRSDKKTINPVICTLDSFLAEIMIDSEVLATKKDIQVNLVKNADIPNQAKFDPSRLKEALENLISNAIKYSKERTHVSISVELNDEKNKLTFSVKDEGQGIPEQELTKLFKDFGKTSVRPTANEPSTGLGLANVKRLIEAHGGEVFVKSQIGHGSTFGFWIPY